MHERFFAAGRQRANVILWWGSFYERQHLTIGDAHAVENVSSRLIEQGFDHCIVSLSDFEFAAPVLTSLEELNGQIERIIFTCGPLNEAPPLADAIRRNPQARKIAVGVSVLPNQLSFAKEFDRIVARDGVSDAYFDLAPARYVATPEPARSSLDNVSLCFVGRQGEYGASRMSLHQQAEAILATEAGETGLEVRTIDTVFSRPENTADKILGDFRSAGIVATTRLHGSLYSLLEGKPVVALDQIPGGAKVSSLMSTVRWPVLLRADSANATDIRSAFDRIRGGSLHDEVLRARAEIIERSEHALDAAVSSILEN